MCVLTKCAHVCGSQRPTPAVVPHVLSTMFLEARLLIGLGLVEKAGWSLSPRGSPVSVSSALGLHVITPHPPSHTFLQGREWRCQEVKKQTQGCTASKIPTRSLCSPPLPRVGLEGCTCWLGYSRARAILCVPQGLEEPPGWDATRRKVSQLLELLSLSGWPRRIHCIRALPRTHTGSLLPWS